MWIDFNKYIESVRNEPWADASSVPEDFWKNLESWLQGNMFPDFLLKITRLVEEIIEIDPDLSEQEILENATRYMVEFLGARSASVRIYDPHTQQMLSYGSYPSKEEYRRTYIPLDNSVSGQVVMTRRTYLVPNIMEEDLYHDKGVIDERGTHSLMAIPLSLSYFSPHERDRVGVIQIYFPENNRSFSPIEIQMAELMAKRLSFVIARKKILSLHKLNEKKEAIVRNIFLKLGSREGVKMKEVFNRVIPELADIINLQSCALFSLTEDDEHVILDAAYPETIGYHGIGKIFPIRNEPVFQMVLNRLNYTEDSPYDVVTPTYALVMDPQKSRIISEKVKRFTKKYNINSILYIPLNVGEDITHFMTIDALEQRQRYADEEVEIFLFLGRELMKAQRMEQLDDILHDFKNPAIATAGFARRLKHMFEKDGLERDDPKVKKYLDILMEETSRLQEMALSLYHIGKEQTVDLSKILKNRFEINKEAIREQLKQNVDLREGPFEEPVYVHCYPLHLERIIDNLLNNATNAIPLKGGYLSIQTYVEGEWACAVVSNSGRISEEERLRLLEGEGKGRGIYITHRIIRLLNGKIDIRIGRESTTLIVRLPLHKD